MTASQAQPSRFERLVASFAERVAGVVHTAVVSAEGMPLARSERLSRDLGDQVAAVTSGLMSLTQGAARCFAGGSVIQTVVEMDRGVMLIASISDGSWLTVLARPNSDVDLIGHEMTSFVRQAAGSRSVAL